MTINEIGECIGVYEDDIYLNIVVEAVKEEFKNSIPDFDENNMTPRQRVLLIIFTQDLYDNRVLYQDKKEVLKSTINSMLWKEYYKKV
nr:MAG TPA: tail connector protein [Caudoviricetes sp.]